LDGVKQYIASRQPFEFTGKWTAATQFTSNIPSENKAGVLPIHYFEAKENKLSHTALIVLQEWWGVNDQIKNRAKEFGGKGVSCVIPDLYRGKVAQNREEANHLMSGLDWSGAITDVKATIKFLRGQGYMKLFVVGYCMGGALSLASTVLAGSELSGGIAYYGIPGKDLADVSKVLCPVQLHFGTNDNHAGFSDAKAADNLEETLKKSKAVYDFHRYEGLGHAFTNVTHENYNEKGANQALDRTVAFIEKYSK